MEEFNDNFDDVDNFPADIFGDELAWSQSTGLTSQPADWSPFGSDLLDFDLPELLPAVETASLEQLVPPAGLVADPDFFIFDPNLFMTPFGVTSESSLQPALSEAPNTAVLTKNIASSAATFNFDLIDSPDLFNLEPHPHGPSTLSEEVTTSLFVPRKKLQPTSTVSLHCRRNKPLQAKAPTTSQEPEVQSMITNPNIPKSAKASSRVGIASQATSIMKKGKRKRAPSPYAQTRHIPAVFCNQFQVTGAEDEKQQQLAIAKRRKVAKACLRCQSQNLGVNGWYTLRVLS